MVLVLLLLLAPLGFWAPFAFAADIELIWKDIDVSFDNKYGEGNVYLLPYNRTHYGINGKLQLNVPLDMNLVWCHGAAFERKGNTFLDSASYTVNYTFCDMLKDNFTSHQYLKHMNMTNSCEDYMNVPFVFAVNAFYMDTTPFVHMLHGSGWKLMILCQIKDDVLVSGHAIYDIDRTNLYRKRKGRIHKN